MDNPVYTHALHRSPQYCSTGRTSYSLSSSRGERATIRRRASPWWSHTIDGRAPKESGSHGKPKSRIVTEKLLASSSSRRTCTVLEDREEVIVAEGWVRWTWLIEDRCGFRFSRFHYICFERRSWIEYCVGQWLDHMERITEDSTVRRIAWI